MSCELSGCKKIVSRVLYDPMFATWIFLFIFIGGWPFNAGGAGLSEKTGPERSNSVRDSGNYPRRKGK